MDKKQNKTEDSVESLRQRLEKAEADLVTVKSALEEMRNRMIESEKLATLGEMVGSVAHEINTPVGIGITVSSHLLEDTLQIKELVEKKKIKRSHLQDYIAMAQESSELVLKNLERAGDLVKSLKTVSSDQTSREKRTFTLPTYIDDILLSLTPRLKRSKHAVMVQCDGLFEVNSYPGAFAQIITNLMMNALRHAFPDNSNGSIQIKVKLEEDKVIVRFSDDGVGISQQDLPHIFTTFFTTKRNQGGTGLGLSIVYNLVRETLKGKVQCQSVPEKGTVFIIEFPQAAPSNGLARNGSEVTSR